MTGSIEDIARRHYEAEAAALVVPVTGGPVFLVHVLAALGLAVSLFFDSLFPSPAARWIVFFGGPLLWFASVPGSRFIAARRVTRTLAAFRAGDPKAVQPVYEFALREFPREIEAHRARTLGSDSEWVVARGSLTKAADEAQRAMSYWGARVDQEPTNEVASAQLRRASRLRKKIRSAVAKLDARADVLLRFYNDCEARLMLMDRYNRDLDESRRLEELSGRTDIAIAGAESTLAMIGQQFVREAQAVGQALGGLTRIQIQSLAGEAQLEDIEYLSDRIIESSDAERRVVEELDRELNRA